MLRADSHTDTIWVNKLERLIFRVHRTGGRNLLVYLTFCLPCFSAALVYAHDLRGRSPQVFTGERKFLHFWIWLLAFEMAGTPFGYHKFEGGFSSEFVGFQLRYDLTEVGISTKRGAWITQWVEKAESNKYVASKGLRRIFGETWIHLPTSYMVEAPFGSAVLLGGGCSSSDCLQTPRFRDPDNIAVHCG